MRVFPNHWRINSAFSLIRILSSKSNEKRSLRSIPRGRIDYLELNWKYLLQSLVTFVQLIFESFKEELLGDSDEQQWLNTFERKIAVRSEDDRLTSYEIFIKYLRHSLSLSRTFVTKLSVFIQPSEMNSGW